MAIEKQQTVVVLTGQSDFQNKKKKRKKRSTRLRWMLKGMRVHMPMVVPHALGVKGTGDKKKRSLGVSKGGESHLKVKEKGVSTRMG